MVPTSGMPVHSRRCFRSLTRIVLSATAMPSRPLAAIWKRLPLSSRLMALFSAMELRWLQVELICTQHSLWSRDEVVNGPGMAWDNRHGRHRPEFRPGHRFDEPRDWEWPSQHKPGRRSVAADPGNASIDAEARGASGGSARQAYGPAGAADHAGARGYQPIAEACAWAADRIGRQDGEIVMRFSLRRRVDGLTDDDIDREIEGQQQRAKELIAELAETLEKQAHLWKTLKREDRDGDA